MMIELQFKKEYKEELYTYLHVDNTSYGNMAALDEQIVSFPSKKAIDAHNFKAVFYNYLALAAFCCGKRRKYCVLPLSPDIKGHQGFTALGPVRNKYTLLSDDYTGLGVDRGFTQTVGKANQLFLFETSNFMSLVDLPEEFFGEAFSQCSLFCLERSTANELVTFLNSGEQPALNRLLKDDELFLHLFVAKEVGFYNSMLIKSKTDIENDIDAFFNVIDPSN